MFLGWTHLTCGLPPHALMLAPAGFRVTVESLSKRLGAEQRTPTCPAIPCNNKAACMTAQTSTRCHVVWAIHAPLHGHTVAASQGVNLGAGLGPGTVGQG